MAPMVDVRLWGSNIDDGERTVAVVGQDGRWQDEQDGVKVLHFPYVPVEPRHQRNEWIEAPTHWDGPCLQAAQVSTIQYRPVPTPTGQSTIMAGETLLLRRTNPPQAPRKTSPLGTASRGAKLPNLGLYPRQKYLPGGLLGGGWGWGRFQYPTESFLSGPGRHGLGLGLG